MDHRRKPRKRGDALVSVIYDATLAELTERGYAELTMERVADRASTSKASLYRRWSSRAELVLNAIAKGMPAPEDLPDTGGIRGDLLHLLRSVAHQLSGPAGEAALGVIAETLRDAELSEVVRERMHNSGHRLTFTVLRRGVERGDVGAHALTPRIAGVPSAMLRQHLLQHGPPISDDVIVEIVDEVVLPLVRPRSQSHQHRPSE